MSKLEAVLSVYGKLKKSVFIGDEEITGWKIVPLSSILAKTFSPKKKKNKLIKKETIKIKTNIFKVWIIG